MHITGRFWWVATGDVRRRLVVSLTVLTALAGTVAAQSDFGDAPSSYPTSLADDGARHAASVFFNPFLGDGVDYEADGLASTDATGDDTDGTEDEDGVTLPAVLTAGTNFEIVVKLSGLSSFGQMSAWIDFNGDGDWLDAGEKIATNRVLGAGTTNTLTVFCPDAARSGTTFARFRISTEKDLAPTGAAADGEVEDYRVDILHPAPTNDIVINAITGEADKVTVQWQTASNVVAQLQSCPDISVASPEWNDVGTAVRSPDSMQTHAAPPGDLRFYRLVLPFVVR